MRFRMLGPLEVWSPEGWTSISAGKWRSLLACLLLKPGQIIPTEALIQELWGDAPPSTANNLVSIYVHRLRRLIGDAEGRIIVHRKPGYQLRLDDGDTDLNRFEALSAEARAALAGGDTETAAARLTEAERLWRGHLLADVTSSVLVATEAERTLELRLTAAELRIGADLAGGRHGEVVPELRSLAAEHPLREGLWLLLMRALDGAGRHAEALDTYGQARTAISDELGVDPGPELQQLYAELLAADAAPRVPPQRSSPGGRMPGSRPDGQADGHASRPAGQAPATAPGTAGAAGRGAARAGGPADDGDETVVGKAQGTIALGRIPSEAIGGEATGSGTAGGGAPAGSAGALAELAEPPFPQLGQLPMDIGDFTGRATEVRHLCDMLTRRDEASGPGAVRIAMVAGAAGLGKTTLAVHAAHQVRDRFPDGQLYVDLSGASAHPTPPGEVLARFLRDLGVDGDKIPASQDERAALYRTRLTGRRVLVLLDNASDGVQIRPLLPGSASCAVLVTTRNRAPALASTRFVDLNTLSDVEALELFARLVGDGRPADEPDATAEVLLACAGLPLAIRICAARLAARRKWKVATLASRLRNSRRRLDEMQAGDLEVRSSFQVSYDALGASRGGGDPMRTFRLLGLWQGRIISLSAASALTGLREEDAAPLLEQLVDANLLESPAADWYQFHDLLRVYAGERVEDEEPEGDRVAAVERLLRWYLNSADAAAQIVSPHRYRIPLDSLETDSPPQPASSVKQAVSSVKQAMSSVDDALAWYDSERDNLAAATRQASSSGAHDIAWQLPTALFSVFTRRGSWADCVATHRVALDSVRKVGHRQGEGWVLHNLGVALERTHDEASIGYLEEALAIRREIGDRTGEAQALLNLADAHNNLHGPEAAVEPYLQALAAQREEGPTYRYAITMNNLGEVYLGLGRLEEAVDSSEKARAIFTGIGSSNGEAYSLQCLGRAYMGLARQADSIDCLRRAISLHRLTGDHLGEALDLKFLGTAQRGIGEPEQARTSWNKALEIFRGLGEKVHLTEIESELRSLPGHTEPPPLSDESDLLLSSAS
jgi:DNA-binding SARP family transcriptional activator